MRQVRRTVGEGNAGHERGVCVDLAGSNIGIVLGEPFFERLQGLVHLGRLVKYFRGAGPDHDQAVASVGLLEGLYVVHQRVGFVEQRTLGLDVWPIDQFDVILVEDGCHRLNLLQLRLDLLQKFRLQHRRVDGSLVGVVLKDVPAAKY